MAPAATASPPSTGDQTNQPEIPLPLSVLNSSDSSVTLPKPTQRALVTALYTLPSTTQPDDESQTAMHDLSALLEDSLARHGWTDRVRALGLELLRNGTCTSFPELVAEVTRRAKVPRGRTASHGPDETGRKSKDGRRETNGAGAATTNEDAASTTTNLPNGTHPTKKPAHGHSSSISVREGWFGPDGLPDVRIPLATVEDGVDFLKDRIKEVVEVIPALDSEDSDSE